MQFYERLSRSLVALYGALVVGMAAAISHKFQYQLDGKALSGLISSTAILAFQTVFLWQLSAAPQGRVTPDGQGRTGQLQGSDEKTAKPSRSWLMLLGAFHLGLWLFVGTVWAGVLQLPWHVPALAPLGGQLLLICYLVLAALVWKRT
jgi:uncharacterized membrane protein YgdD (TMEM256/DUF423 family)